MVDLGPLCAGVRGLMPLVLIKPMSIPYLTNSLITEHWAVVYEGTSDFEVRPNRTVRPNWTVRPDFTEPFGRTFTKNMYLKNAQFANFVKKSRNLIAVKNYPRLISIIDSDLWPKPYLII